MVNDGGASGGDSGLCRVLEKHQMVVAEQDDQKLCKQGMDGIVAKGLGFRKLFENHTAEGNALRRQITDSSRLHLRKKLLGELLVGRQKAKAETLEIRGQVVGIMEGAGGNQNGL